MWLAGESVSQGWSIVSRGFRGVYDYAGTVMILSIIWFFIGLIPTLYAFLVFVQVPAINSILIMAVLAVAVTGPMTAGVYSICDKILRGEATSFRAYVAEVRRFYGKSVKVSALLCIFFAVLAIDVIFFVQVATGWMRLLSVVWMYFLFFFILMLQYVFPLIVRKDPTVLETLKMSALLALDNVVASLIVALATAAAAVAYYYLRVPLMLFMAGTLGFLHCAALDALLKKYGGSSGAAGGTAEGEEIND